jgi:hypothetical protein
VSVLDLHFDRQALAAARAAEARAAAARAAEARGASAAQAAKHRVQARK